MEIIFYLWSELIVAHCTGTSARDSGWLLACRPSAERVRYCNVDTSHWGWQS